MSTYTTVDEYIQSQPAEVAERLSAIRALFHKLLPDTKESISYNIPAFTVGSDKLYIAGYAHHVGMYPMYGIPELDAKILPYRGEGTKDSLHFQNTEPLPLELIEEIITTKADK